jgi:hypothetical protein
MARSLPTGPVTGAGDMAGGGVTPPVATGKEAVLANIISVLYNKRLVEGGGGIFTSEKNQTQNLVDAAGGGSPGGFINAAKILLKHNSSLASMIPDRLDGPIPTRRIRSSPLFSAIKETQRTIHSYYEKAFPGIINPGDDDKAVKKIREFMKTDAGGKWSFANNQSDRLVKLAERRKQKVMAEVAAELTPAERAALRIFKMKGVW